MKKRATPAQMAASHPDTKVVVKLVKDTVTGRVEVQISVASNALPMRWSHTKLDPDHPKLVYNVEKCAEKLAEFQCECYGDRHNPPGVGRAAREALMEIMAKADRATTRQAPTADFIKESEQ